MSKAPAETARSIEYARRHYPTRLTVNMMSTITVYLGELKERVDVAAAKARKSPHDYIIDVISEAIGRDEVRAEFVGSALARRERLQQTGRSVSFEDMETSALSERSLESKPITYLASHATEIIDGFDSNAEPLVITQNGEEKLVVMSVRQYEQDRQSMALLRGPVMGRDILERMPFNDDPSLGEVKPAPLPNPGLPQFLGDTLRGLDSNDESKD